KVSLLLIGESGAGKTTLRLAIRDYLNGTTFEDVRSAIDEEDEYYDERDTKRPEDGSAQTLTCLPLHFENDEFGVDVIDTPGFVDPKGATQDQKNWEDICSYVDKLEFNAIVIVLKGNTNRLHPGLKQQLFELHQRLHEECKKKILLFYTLYLMQQLRLPFRAYTWLDNERYKQGFNFKMAKWKNRCNFEDNCETIRKLLTIFQGSTVCAIRKQEAQQKIQYLYHRIEKWNNEALLQALETYRDNMSEDDLDWYESVEQEISYPYLKVEQTPKQVNYIY
ncbi:hypothetical protein RFI_22440, partial [Reticulomyxa filosa]